MKMMEPCVGPRSYVVYSLILLSCGYIVHKLEAESFFANIIAIIFVLWSLYVAQNLIPRGRVNPDGKAVFITGCDTGFGHKLAVRCDQLGLRVFAGCLFPDGADAKHLSSQCSKRLTIVPCDVTLDDSVTAARDMVSEAVIKENLVFWACVNNAGITRVGEIDMLPMHVLKQVMEVNTFGAIRVTKAFMTMIRHSKGHFVNITSIVARWCYPTGLAYGMSKMAADIFSDVLRYEMHKWGVKVAIIQPWLFLASTLLAKFFDSAKARADFIWNGTDKTTQAIYGRAYIDNIQEAITEHGKNDCYDDNTPVIDALIDAVLSESPKHRYVVGGVFAPLMWQEVLRYNLLPTWISDIKMIKWQTNLGLPAALQEKDSYGYNNNKKAF